MKKRKVLIVGWDAADWKVMKPLMDQGHMPCVSQFVERGVMGNLATLKPVLSPMLWNSIATGKRPDKHGILGFTEFNPHLGQVSPSLSTSRKVKALWNMASQEGYKSHVVNWFASHPAEKINGICVTETYSKPPKPNQSWVLSKDSIHPESHFEALNELRLHTKELDGDILQMFCPLAHKVDLEKDKRLEALAKQIVEALNVHTAATYVLENEEWDFAAIYYGAIDHFCHLFMNFHPPKRPDVTEEDYEIYHDVVNNCYRFHDVMLARLLELAGEDTTVIVCSDHGFRSDHLRPPYTPMVPAGPAYWHRDQGVIMMAGPGIVEDELVHGATLLDIAPTVLSLLGLPVARDMDGRVLSEVLTSPDEVSFIESWETREGDHPNGMHPDNARMSVEDSQAILDQFVALGYIDPPDEDKDKAAINAQREAKWNLAASFIDAGQIDQAIALLAELADEYPDRKDIVVTLANCLQGIGLLEEAKAISLAAMKHDVDAAAANHTLAEIALADGNAEEALKYLEQLPELDGESQQEFSEFYQLGRALTLAGTYRKLRQWDKALENFLKVLELDPDHVRAVHGACEIFLKLKRNDEALDYALRAVELEYRSFLGHHLLGVAFARHEEWQRSMQACLVALRFRPGQIATMKILALCYKKLNLPGPYQDTVLAIEKVRDEREASKTANRDNLDEVKERLQKLATKLEHFYDEQAREKKEQEKQQKSDSDKPVEAKQEQAPKPIERSGKEFLIVSGLPRSGTSLMMQMLAAGGVAPMTDHERTADVDNPEGYFEWEDIKKLKSDPSLIEQAEGKVTKVISMLLPHLPKQHDYKIIFLMRPIEEVVASQQKMIDRLQTQGANLDTESLIQNLTQHRATILKLLRQMPAKVFMLKYQNLIEKTENAVKSVVDFLGDDYQLDVEAMTQQVKPELWRNRASSLAGSETSQQG